MLSRFNLPTRKELLSFFWGQRMGYLSCKPLDVKENFTKVFDLFTTGSKRFKD